MGKTLADLFIGLLLIVDTFFVFYAGGLNSRHVKIVDPSLAPKAVAAVQTATTAVTTTTPIQTAPVVSSPPVTPGKFEDISTTEQRLQPLVQKAAEAGIIDPTQDQKFRPNDPVTRADFTRWMVRVRQVPLASPEVASYVDVDQFNPYYQDIEGATLAKLVQGYNIKGATAKEFKPDQYITREEFAVMYCTFSGKRSRAEKLTPREIDDYLKYDPSNSAEGTKTYNDVGDINDWARKWVAVAHQAGVLEQCFDCKVDSSVLERRYFRPQQRMTRAEGVSILVKLYGIHLRTAEDIAKTLEGQGVYYERPGLYKEAEAMYRNALALNEKAHGANTAEVAKTANILASLYQTQGDYSKAEPLYKRSIEIGKSGLGKDNSEVTKAKNSLAILYRAQGKFSDAEALYKDLLETDSRSAGAQSSAVASDLNALTNLAMLQGKTNDAKQYQVRAMEIIKKLPGSTRITSMPTDLVAAPKPARPVKDKWALIVGISKFQDSQINLKYAAKDAIDFRQFLISEEGFVPDHIKLLTDKEATRDNIIANLGEKWLGRLANPDDLVVVYVSSHGSTTKEDVGVNFLVAYDTNKSSLIGSGIPMQWLTKIIHEQVHADRILLVLDVCHSGSATGGKGIARDGFDIDKVPVGTGQAVLCSSLADQLSWESKKYQNSVFTRYLIEAFRSKGKQTRLDDAFQFLRDRVQQEVLRDRYELQTPVLKKAWEGDDLVLAVPPSSPRSGL